MLSRNLALLGLIGLTLAAMPSQAPAADPAPIVVKSCDIDHLRLALAVTFTNTSAQPIKDVLFAVTSRDGVLSTKDDAGTYAPGDVVTHRLRIDFGAYFGPWAKIGCTAARVTFADGTTWDNPLASADMAKNIPQTPGSNIEVSKCFVSDSIYIEFSNTAQQDVAKFDLGIVQRGLLVFSATETGPFAAGVVSKFRGNKDDRGDVVSTDLLQTRCIVLNVTYADGTTWKNPSLPPESFKGIALDPPSPAPETPITIDKCDGSSMRNYPGSWEVHYTNASQKPTVAADFALVMHGNLLATAREIHNLSPGEGSRAQWPLLDPNFRYPTCTVVRVDYADGTEWINPLFAPVKN